MRRYEKRIMDESVVKEDKSDVVHRITNALVSTYEASIIYLYGKTDVNKRVFFVGDLISMYGHVRVCKVVKDLKLKGFMSGLDKIVGYKDGSMDMVLDKDFLRKDFKGCNNLPHVRAYIEMFERKHNIGQYWYRRDKKQSRLKRSDVDFVIKF